MLDATTGIVPSSLLPERSIEESLCESNKHGGSSPVKLLRATEMIPRFLIPPALSPPSS
jgi:hypothetical protein